MNIEFCIIDKSNDIFSGSSFNNQNRLHIGFHYPRSYKTIYECINGYNQFINIYNFLTNDINNNYYYIDNNSTISYKEYIEIYNKLDITYKIIDYNEIENTIYKLNNTCNKIISVNEKYIDNFKSKEFFINELKDTLIKIDNSHIFDSINNIINYLNIKTDDIIINCTYNQLEPIIFDKYELFIILLYKKKKINNDLGVTIMDGPFYSLYPFDLSNNIYSLTSVKYGPIYISNILIEPNIIIENYDINKLINIIENDFIKYMDSFKNYFEYYGFKYAWKTKPITNCDDRSVQSNIKNNIISIYGGKITGIFEASNIVIDFLKNRSYI
jgi:hypothetical protein